MVVFWDALGCFSLPSTLSPLGPELGVPWAEGSPVPGKGKWEEERREQQRLRLTKRRGRERAGLENQTGETL